MLAQLELGAIRQGSAGPEQLAKRKELAQRLVIEESRHEAVEELYFWPAVRSHLTDGDDLADLARDQEQQAKFILDRLDKVSSPEHEEFEDQITHFISVGRSHIEFEETAVWPGLRAALTANEADDLGRELAEAKDTAPTRPHPNTPPTPGLLKAAGAAVAAADRFRDAVTGRGEE